MESQRGINRTSKQIEKSVQHFLKKICILANVFGFVFSFQPSKRGQELLKVSQQYSVVEKCT
jgi:hypothetical protein